MNEYRSVLERAGSNFAPLDLELETVLRRRDRKRRNQRIAAGVVGIAVFVAAVWIVTSVKSLDRSETSVVPGVSGTTRPTETGPAETGPTTTGSTAAPDNSFRIPPAGTAVSTPVEGELIAEAYVDGAGEIRVYADGRVLSAKHYGGLVVERRLSPEGVELVRQTVGERVRLGYGPGVVRLESLLGYPGFHSGDIPQGAWEDRVGIPHVPARYAACFWHVDSPPDFEALLEALPGSAQALLRGSDPGAWNPRCLVMTPEEARSLEEILSEALSSSGNLSGWDVGGWGLPLDATKTTANGDVVEISLVPLFPEGRRFFQVPCCAINT